MKLRRRSRQANEVRVPAVARGEAVVVERYRADKAAVINPEDLAMFERSHELLEAAGELEPLTVSDLALKVHEQEERPSGDPVGNARRIAELLE